MVGDVLHVCGKEQELMEGRENNSMYNSWSKKYAFLLSNKLNIFSLSHIQSKVNRANSKNVMD